MDLVYFIDIAALGIAPMVNRIQKSGFANHSTANIPINDIEALPLPTDKTLPAVRPQAYCRWQTPQGIQ